MSALVALNASKDQVTDLKLSASYVALVVAPHGLLVLGGVKESDVACLVQLVDGVFEGNLVPFFV